MYITLGEAEKIVPVARSTFRKHAKAGKFSTSTNARGLQIVQVAELERFYDGKLKPLPNENGNGNGQHETPETADIDQNGHSETPNIDQSRQVETQPETQVIIELLKSQLQDTKAELADAKDRETKLLSMLETEQEKTKLLMLSPPPAEPETEKKKNSSILGYFRLRR